MRLTVGLPDKVCVERSRLSALVEVATARESRFKSEMTVEASIARESRERSETTGEAWMACESRARSDTSGEASMVRESRPKSEIMEDPPRAVMRLGQSSGMGNCSVSPVEDPPSRVQRRGRRSPRRAPRRGLNSSCGRRAGGRCRSYLNPNRGATVMGIENPVRMRATTGWAARVTLIGRGIRIGVSPQDGIEPRGGVYGRWSDVRDRR